MRAVVFSGTTEGRAFSKQLGALGADVLVSVATDLGAEEQGSAPGVTVRAGRLEPEEMTALLQGADLCIDATHPYAVEVTKNLQGACHRLGVPLRRLLRPESSREGCVQVASCAQAAAFLADKPGNILLTTGAKELAAFASLPLERLYPRILPVVESISACQKIGVSTRNIIAMHGPFTQKLNEAMLEQFQIRYLVTKDGGSAGGFLEKVRAAQDAGVELVVIRRPRERRWRRCWSGC